MNPNTRSDGSGFTPLILAAEHGHTEIVKALIASGADVNMKDKHGATALTAAQALGHTRGPEIVRILKEAGAKE